MKAVRCSLCGGEPEFVYYAIPVNDNPLGWEWDDEGIFPIIKIKQIRCKKCGTVCPAYDMICDDAVRHWNEQKLLELIGTGYCDMNADGEMEE